MVGIKNIENALLFILSNIFRNIGFFAHNIQLFFEKKSAKIRLKISDEEREIVDDWDRRDFLKKYW